MGGPPMIAVNRDFDPYSNRISKSVAIFSYGRQERFALVDWAGGPANVAEYRNSWAGRPCYLDAAELVTHP